jgi:hypothetical protein
VKAGLDFVGMRQSRKQSAITAMGKVGIVGGDDNRCGRMP